jgi:hypothetical protein
VAIWAVVSLVGEEEESMYHFVKEDVFNVGKRSELEEGFTEFDSAASSWSVFACATTCRHTFAGPLCSCCEEREQGKQESEE